MTADIKNSDSSPDITFCVACYNEEANVIAAIGTVLGAAAEVGCTYDIVLIDDASTDGTVAVIREYMRDNPKVPIKLLVNSVNQGLGINYAEAAFHGNGRYYRLICGDDEERQESLRDSLRHLGKADMILTYHSDSNERPLARRLISRCFTGLVNVLAGHRIRYYNGLPIVRRDVVTRWHSHTHGFGFQAELITRLLDMGATYIEVPVVPKQRSSGSSKAFTFRNLASVLHTFMEVIIRRVGRMMYPRYVRKFAIQVTSEATPGFQRASSNQSSLTSSVCVTTGADRSAATVCIDYPTLAENAVGTSKK